VRPPASFPGIPVPEALAERARQLAEGRLTVVPARPASTVVLLRDGAAGLEFYVLRRRSTMAFAAGMYAFPGGAVDPRDRDSGIPEWECAAARELFEETGVLLAGASPAELVADATGDDYEADRMALVGKVLPFSEFLARRGLVLRTDLLVRCAHWVTPDAEERRYDTRFYLAAMPAGQRTRDVSGEADRVAWLRPADALAAVERGEMRMLPPTAATIGSLLDAGTVADALAAARARPDEVTRPQVVIAGGEAHWSLG
jgi:8-oxo-dGTP pyrophosphatase MutT (NUDIX family)